MEAVFTFHTTHGAITGERVLEEAGVKVRVMALPSSLGAGCGLCLRVAAEALEEAAGRLAAASIYPQGAYFKRAESGRISYEPAPLSLNAGQSDKGGQGDKGGGQPEGG